MNPQQPAFRRDLDDVELSNLFEDLRSNYGDLYLPSETDLLSLTSELHEARQKIRTVRYMSASLVAILLFATVPLIMAQGFRAVSAMQPKIVAILSKKDYLDQHPELSFAAALACFAAVVYTTLLHQPWMSLFHHLERRAERRAYFTAINRTDWHFIAFIALVNYVVAGVGLLYLCSYTDPSGAIPTWSVRAWVLLPILPLSVLPAFLAMFLIVFLTWSDLFTHAPQAALLLEHLRLLHMLKGTLKPAQLTSSLRREAMYQISKMARMFARLYETKTREPSVVWASGRMKLAADNFLVLASWIAFPKPDTITEVKRRIVASANAVAAGTYDMLPTQVVGEDAGLVREMRRATHLRHIGGFVALLHCCPYPSLFLRRWYRI